jgi:NDP-sugar pyrophosphorylase family protein
MILAAGFGTRLRPLTDTLPKPLAPVAGVPFLDHVLALLRRGGIREVVINLHHLGHLIEQHIGDGARHGLAVRYSREATILDTGGGIKHAETLLGGETFVVVNGDSLLDVDLRAIADDHRAHGAIATLALRRVPDPERYGVVEVDDADRVRRISGRPADAGPAALRRFMFPGLHVLEPAIFAHMPAGGAFGIVRATYPALIEQGLPVRGWVTDARWINIDDLASLRAADRELRRNPLTPRT